MAETFVPQSLEHEYVRKIELSCHATRNLGLVSNSRKFNDRVAESDYPLMFQS